MRVAIFGARGFIGRHLCDALTVGGDDVVAVSSREGGFDPSTGLVRMPPIDITADSIVYLSQSPHYRDAPAHAAHLWAVNVVSAVRVAVWARDRGVRNFVYASSGSVYAPAFEPHTETSTLRRDDWYALSKIQGEEAVAMFSSCMNISVLRLFGVYGPLQHGMLLPRLIDRIRMGEPIRLQPHPTNTSDRDGLRVSMCYIDDAVEALRLAAAGAAPRVMNVAGSEPVSIRRLADAIGQRLGIGVTYCVDPEPRGFDLLADNAVFRRLLPRTLVPIETGLAATMSYHASDIS